MTLVLTTYLSASVDASLSRVLVHNSEGLVASKSLAFTVVPVDSTNMTILDSSEQAFSAELITQSSAVACGVTYSPQDDSHSGACTLPASGTAVMKVTSSGASC